MKTFREYFEKYIVTNPHHLKKAQIDRIRSSGSAFKLIENEPYVLVSTEVIDTIIRSTKSDFSRTKCTFIIRELDRLAAIDESKDKITHPYITQKKSILYALNNNQAYVDAKIRSIALKNNEMQEGTFGYALLRLLIDKETISSENCIKRLRCAASKFEKLYDKSFENISDSDIQEVMSACPESMIYFCNHLLKSLNLCNRGKEIINE